MSEYKLTAEGKAELEKEQAERIANRAAISERIAIARDFGDLRENAEYSAAKEEQAQNENRIKEIQRILDNSTVIEKTGTADVVTLGSVVVVKNQDGEAQEFKVVGKVEANPMEGLISDESPRGLALLGKKAGDKAEVQLPAKTVTFTVEKIS